jgi:hypothetical protein
MEQSKQHKQLQEKHLHIIIDNILFNFCLIEEKIIVNFKRIVILIFKFSHIIALQ